MAEENNIFKFAIVNLFIQLILITSMTLTNAYTVTNNVEQATNQIITRINFTRQNLVSNPSEENIILTEGRENSLDEVANILDTRSKISSLLNAVKFGLKEYFTIGIDAYKNIPVLGAGLMLMIYTWQILIPAYLIGRFVLKDRM